MTATRRTRAGVIVLLVAAALLAANGVGEQGARAQRRQLVPAGVIKHVVVIYQENRTFDEVLGDYCVLHNHKCNGTIGPVTLKGGATTMLAPSPDSLWPDPPHWVGAQDAMIDGGKMDGWATVPQCFANGINECLTYYAPNQIPTLTKLADHYAISDRTFSMQDSPSWGGHMYAAAASQDNFTGDIPTQARGVAPGPGWGCDSKLVQTWIDPVTHVASQQPACVPAPAGTLDPVKYPYNGAFAPTKAQSIPTIFDRLDAKALSYKLYSNIWIWSVCPIFAKCLYTSQLGHMTDTSNVFNDARLGRLPAFSLVLPGGPGGTDQHAPASMLLGDNWIGKIVNAIRSGPQWSSTAIFITYDDCGCYYDHVPPGRNPDGTAQGPRMPMVIVSPYAKAGYVDSTPATFPSILHFAEESLGLAPLTVNDANAYDYGNSFDFTRGARTDHVALPQQPIPASTWRFIAQHPEITQPNEDS